MRQLSAKVTGDLYKQLQQDRESAERRINAQFRQSVKMLEERCTHDETLTLNSGRVFCRGCFVDVEVAA